MKFAARRCCPTDIADNIKVRETIDRGLALGEGELAEPFEKGDESHVSGPLRRQDDKPVSREQKFEFENPGGVEIAYLDPPYAHAERLQGLDLKCSHFLALGLEAQPASARRIKVRPSRRGSKTCSTRGSSATRRLKAAIAAPGPVG